MIPPRKTLERLLLAVLLCLLLVLFIICCSRSQSGHDWHEMYRDDHIIVERCSRCGQERILNPY